MMQGPDIGGGLQDLMSQFMMYQMIQKMYPDKEGKKGKGSPDTGNIFMGQTPLPSGREMPSELPMGQPQPGIDIQQIMQMLQALGGMPGLMK